MNKSVALLIVDVQVAMFSQKVPLNEGERVLENIRSLLVKARAAGIPVIFIQHSGDDGSEFGRGKSAWQIHPSIKPMNGEQVIEKRTCDSFHKTNLDEVLKKEGITDLVIVGMQTEYCIDTTCRRAFSLGYRSILVSDAHSTFDSEILKASQIIRHHNNVLGGPFASLKLADEVDFK